jgi:hypothetical protein
MKPNFTIMASKVMFSSITILFLILIALIPTISADVEPNDDMTNAESTTDFSNVVGDVDIAAGTPDIFDYYALSLTGGSNGDALTINVSVAGLTPPCIMRIFMPSDNGFNFEIVNKTIVMDSVASLNFNATVTGTYLLEFMGGTFSYDATYSHINPGNNPKYDGNDDFASATVLTDGATGNPSMVDGQNYVDIYKFTTAANDLVDINLTGANINAWTTMLLTQNYFDASAGRVEIGSGFYHISFTETVPSTYYIVLNSPSSILSAEGSYSYDVSIKPPAVNVIPVMANALITPTSIVDDKAVNVTFSVDAIDTDGTVVSVNATCALWTGEIALMENASYTWSGWKVIPPGSSIGVHDVVFKATDDRGEWNATAMVEITVVKGTPFTYYYSIELDEDSPDLYVDLVSILTDKDGDPPLFEIWSGDSWGVSYYGDIYKAAMYNDTHLVMHLEENQYGKDQFMVNVSYPEGWFDYIDFNVRVNSVNDVPTWLQFNFLEPAYDPIEIVHNETIYIELLEDVEYDMNITAWDVEDGDYLFYGCNVSNTEEFVVNDAGGHIYFAPTQAHADIGVLYTEFWVFDLDASTSPSNTTEVVFYIDDSIDVPYGSTLDYNIVDMDPEQAGDNNLCVNFTVTRPMDDDGDTSFSYYFDFDGDNDNEFIIFDCDNEFVYTEYTYPSPGTYSVYVWVEDESGYGFHLYLRLVVTEPNLEPEIEWYDPGFEEEDLEPDPSVLISFDRCEIETDIEEDKSLEMVTLTSTYNFAGTCGEDVVVIHIYQYIESTFDVYYPFYDPTDFTEKLEIEPSGTTWSYTLTDVMEIDWELWEAVLILYEEMDDPEPQTQTYAAVAWTEDARYNYDTIEVTWTGETIDNYDDDDDDDTDPPLIDWDEPGDVALFSMFVLGAIIFLVALTLFVIILMIKLKRRGKGEEVRREERRDYDEDDDDSWYCPRCGFLTIGGQCRECGWAWDNIGDGERETDYDR